jgi:hypothetical protein
MLQYKLVDWLRSFLRLSHHMEVTNLTDISEELYCILLQDRNDGKIMSEDLLET